MKNRAKAIVHLLEESKQLFRADRLSFILLTLIFIVEFVVMLTIPLFSAADRFHNIPLLLAGVMCVLILVWIFLRGHFFIDGPSAALVLFSAYNAISTLWGFPSPNVRTPILLTLLAIVVYVFLVQPKIKRIFLWVWYCALFVFALIFLVVYSKELFSGNFDRLGDRFANVNNVGTYFAAGCAFSFLFLFKKKWLAIPGLFLFGALGISTGSRAFFLSFAFSFVVFLVLFFGKKKWYLSAIILVGLSVGLFLVLQLPFFSTIRERLAAMIETLIGGNSKVDGSTSERLSMVVEGFELWLRRPLFGWGANGFETLSYYGSYSHNTFSNLLANGGVLGLALFIYPFASAFSPCVIASKRRKMAALQVKTLALLFPIMFSLLLFGVASTEKLYYFLLAFALSCMRDGSLERCFQWIRFGKSENGLFLLVSSPFGSKGGVLNDVYRIG